MVDQFYISVKTLRITINVFSIALNNTRKQTQHVNLNNLFQLHCVCVITHHFLSTFDGHDKKYTSFVIMRSNE